MTITGGDHDATNSTTANTMTTNSTVSSTTANSTIANTMTEESTKELRTTNPTALLEQIVGLEAQFRVTNVRPSISIDRKALSNL